MLEIIITILNIWNNIICIINNHVIIIFWCIKIVLGYIIHIIISSNINIEIICLVLLIIILIWMIFYAYKPSMSLSKVVLSIFFFKRALCQVWQTLLDSGINIFSISFSDNSISKNLSIAVFLIYIKFFIIYF